MFNGWKQRKVKRNVHEPLCACFISSIFLIIILVVAIELPRNTVFSLKQKYIFTLNVEILIANVNLNYR